MQEPRPSGAGYVVTKNDCVIATKTLPEPDKERCLNSNLPTRISTAVALITPAFICNNCTWHRWRDNGL